MSKNSVDISSLTTYLEKYTKEVGRITAGTIRDELTEVTFSAIVKFYTDYTPKYYKRHYYNFLEKSFKKYYSNAHGNIYRGGVEFTPELMDDIYQNSKGYSSAQVTEQVFDTVFAGIHGVASSQIYDERSGNSNPRSVIPPVMNPSPMEIILMKRKEIIENLDSYLSNAQNKVKI